MAGRRWLLGAFAVFIVLLVVWICAAFILNSGVAESLPFSLSFGSRLGADYGPDELSSPLGRFHLSIISDVFRDRGLSPSEADYQSEKFKLSLNSPVSTATARNFEGEPPYTPTPTSTLTPTETLTPTLTPSVTPTRTRKPTRTPTEKPPPPPPPPPEPTKTSTVTNTPTITYTPTPTDEEEPEISGGTLDPTPGPISDCYEDIYVTDLRVTDPSPSSGIKWVKLKYQVVDYSGLIYSDPITMVSGGPTAGSGWDAYYQGVITFEINTAWDTPASGYFLIQLGAKVHDNAGNEDVISLGEYTMPGSCAD